MNDNFEANYETTLIGLLVMDKGASQILADIDENEFSNPIARRVYHAMKAEWSRTGDTAGLGLIALSMQAEEKEYAYYCAETLVTTDWQLATEKLKERNIVEQAKQVASDLLVAQSVEDVLESQSNLIKATQHEVREVASDPHDLMLSFYKRMESPKKHIKTGYSKLDRYTFIDRGDFVVLAGEQSAGKTAFSISLMIRMARQGYKCVYFSLETSVDKIFDRLVTNYVGLDFSHLKQGVLTQDEYDLVGEAHQQISELPIKIINASGKTVDWIKAEAIRLQADIIFIDYLGLINAKGKSRYEMVTNTSLALHTLAQTTSITVVCLSQLKRPDGTNRKPNMHDLRESGQIEADADLIILLYNDKENNEYSVIVEKNKEGETGIIDFQFDGLHQRFYEVANEYAS